MIEAWIFKKMLIGNEEKNQDQWENRLIEVQHTGGKSNLPS